MDITTTEKHGQQDASSLAVQPESKHVDLKQTPNKSHLVADAHDLSQCQLLVVLDEVVVGSKRVTIPLIY
jgi:phosphoribosylformylglycinamidine (FGAM) synthase-like enzyme